MHGLEAYLSLEVIAPKFNLITQLFSMEEVIIKLIQLSGMKWKVWLPLTIILDSLLARHLAFSCFFFLC